GLLPTLTREVSWRGATRARWTGGAIAATRGLALAIPPVIVFGFLLAAADANYERLLGDFFDVNLGEWLVRGLLVALYAWLCGGVLREMLLAPTRPRAWSDPPRRLSLGT